MNWSEEQDELLFTEMEEVLDGYPHFASMLPKGYPRRGGKSKHRLSYHKLKKFNDKREREEDWYHINLPLVLHNIKTQKHEKAQQLMKSLVNKLEQFCFHYSDVPKIKNVLAPLWTSAWDPQDHTFWSVIGEVSVALLLHSTGFPVQHFAAQIGDSKKDADLRTTINGKATYIDIQMAYLHRDVDKENPGEGTIKDLLGHRSVQKSRQKFESLPSGEQGIVAMVVLPKSSLLKDFVSDSSEIEPIVIDTNKLSWIYYCMGTDLDDTFEFQLCDWTMKVELQE